MTDAFPGLTEDELKALNDQTAGMEIHITPELLATRKGRLLIAQSVAVLGCVKQISASRLRAAKLLFEMEMAAQEAEDRKAGSASGYTAFPDARSKLEMIAELAQRANYDIQGNPLPRHDG